MGFKKWLIPWKLSICHVYHTLMLWVIISQATESKIKSCGLEISALESDIKKFGENANVTAQSYEKEVRSKNIFIWSRNT